SRNQNVPAANISTSRSTEKAILFPSLIPPFSSKPSVLSVAFLFLLCVKFRKAQHRGHKESQRTTERRSHKITNLHRQPAHPFDSLCGNGQEFTDLILFPSAREDAHGAVKEEVLCNHSN